MKRPALIAGSILAAVALGVLCVVGVLRGLDTWRDYQAARQARGELTRAEQRFQAADLARGKAESAIRSRDKLALAFAAALGRERLRSIGRGVEVSRLSTANFTLRAELERLRGHADPITPTSFAYGYSLPWFRFTTPDVRTTGGERLAFDMKATLHVAGLRQTKRNGILESETVDLRFYAPDGEEIPLGVKLDDYLFEYVPPVMAEDKWYQKIHLDLYAAVATQPYATPYPERFDASRAILGAEANVYGVTLGLQGEAALDGDLRALLTVGYRRRLF